jgi:hypothetical protein
VTRIRVSATRNPGVRRIPKRRNGQFRKRRAGVRGPVGEVGRSQLARDAKTARALWTLSEQLTGTEFPL